jgi:hypothetical protein
MYRGTYISLNSSTLACTNVYPDERLHASRIHSRTFSNNHGCTLAGFHARTRERTKALTQTSNASLHERLFARTLARTQYGPTLAHNHVRTHACTTLERKHAYTHERLNTRDFTYAYKHAHLHAYLNTRMISTTHGSKHYCSYVSTHERHHACLVSRNHCGTNARLQSCHTLARTSSCSHSRFIQRFNARNLSYTHTLRHAG